jgi:hypothetical protein
VGDILGRRGEQVTLSVDQHVVQTFAADRAHPPFRVRVRPRGITTPAQHQQRQHIAQHPIHQRQRHLSILPHAEALPLAKAGDVPPAIVHTRR